MFQVDNSFTRELIGDRSYDNRSRIVENACYSTVLPRIPSQPKLIHFSSHLADKLGISTDVIYGSEFLKIVSGSAVPPDTEPYAMCYGGHQFGQWAGQLGDGRAINLFEHLRDTKRYSLQLKGAGTTPYSRNADGLAVLRSSLREHLCSEAMHFLGIPTTRSLSLVLTGDNVIRDILYNGNPQEEKGAIVCRVAPSFIRFGNFEIFAARKDIVNLKSLTDYTIKYFYPHITSLNKEGYVTFFGEVCQRTLELMLDWQRVGFVHGVMNTDNMSILGLTIDYGPYGWLEGYDPDWTPNTTDAQTRRYRYDNQPMIALWNLLQLANALYPLIEDVNVLEKILDDYHANWNIRYREMMLSKLGLTSVEATPQDIVKLLENTMILTETDMTIFFRLLSNVKKEMTAEEALNAIHVSFYSDKLTDDAEKSWIIFFQEYLSLLNNELLDNTDRKEKMNQINPKYVLRNYMAQLAIDAADNGDYSLIEEIYILLQKPYDEQLHSEKWFAKRPEWARTKVGCSMLSCSS